MPRSQAPQTLTGLARVLSRLGKRGLVVPDGEAMTKISGNRIAINVSGLGSFSRVRAGGSKVTIGAGASFGRVLREVDGENGLLRQAISMLANPLIRNRIAVLTALDSESTYFDFATALVALGSRVTIQSTSGSRRMPIGDFLIASANGLNNGEFPAFLEFSKLTEEWRVGFFRVNPGGGKNTVSASVRMKLRGNIAVEPQIIVSSSTIIPVLTPEASRSLARRPLNEPNIKNAAEVAAEEMLEMADLDDDPYESSLIEVAVSRALRRANQAQR